MPEILSLPQYPSIMQDRRRYSSLTHADKAYYVSPRPQSTLIATNSHWQHLSITGASQALTEHVAHTHYSTLFNSFPNHEAEWPMDSAIPMTCTTTLPVNLSHNMEYAVQAEYPESSQRTSIPSPGNAPSDYHFKIGVPRSPSGSPVCSNERKRLHTIDELEEPLPFPQTSTSSPPIKMEQSDGDGCFVMELSAAQVNAISLSQSMAPPTEVPLRATHASEEMRKMMGRFRIDPFAIHNGENRGIVASWGGGEACPLEEEPLIFEFQLDLDSRQDALKDSSNDTRASQDSNEYDCDWEEYYHESFLASNTSSEWNASDSGDQVERTSEPATDFYHQQQLQELQNPAYLRKCAEASTSVCEPYFRPETSTHEVRIQRAEPQGQFWSRGDSYSAPRTTTSYGADSPGCDNAILPPISATINRRWSVPDPNLVHEAQFLLQ